MRLYLSKEKIFPEFIRIDGERVAVNADFRNILRIFAMMKDGNISDYKKIYKLCEWFICGLEIQDYTQVMKAFADFINHKKASNQDYNGANPEIEEERQFCYEFDGEEIYAGFLSEYNIDLIECEFLHWYKFRMMLANLSESSSFKKKIALRFLDLSRFSREESGFYEIMQTYESIQLPREYTDEEVRETQEFKDFWERV